MSKNKLKLLVLKTTCLNIELGGTNLSNLGDNVLPNLKVLVKLLLSVFLKVHKPLSISSEIYNQICGMHLSNRKKTETAW